MKFTWNVEDPVFSGDGVLEYWSIGTDSRKNNFFVPFNPSLPGPDLSFNV
jgi:hypothetical protein